MKLPVAPLDHATLVRASRVCLPHQVDLLQLSRWMRVACETGSPAEFRLIVGERSYAWSGTDEIDLFAEIQRRCINDGMAHSWVICESPRSMLFLDEHQRFSFFSAEPPVVQALYPFSREVMWEYFALVQDQDDIPLSEIFEVVHVA